MTVFVYSQTINKLVNEAANDSARVSGQDRKISPALGTYQIAGCGGLAWKSKTFYCTSQLQSKHSRSQITVLKRNELQRNTEFKKL